MLYIIFGSIFIILWSLNSLIKKKNSKKRKPLNSNNLNIKEKGTQQKTHQDTKKIQGTQQKAYQNTKKVRITDRKKSEDKTMKNQRQIVQYTIPCQNHKNEITVIENKEATIHPGQTMVKFNFNYCYEKNTNTVMIFFATKNDLLRFQALITGDQEGSHDVLKYFQNYQNAVKKQLKLKQPAGQTVYEMVSNLNHVNETANNLAKQRYPFKSALLILDNEGHLVGGKLKDQLKSKEKINSLEDKYEVNHFLTHVRYFYENSVNTIIVYFTDEDFSTQLMEDGSKSWKNVQNLCQFMLSIKPLIEKKLNLSKSANLWVMPGAAKNRKNLINIVLAITKDGSNIIDKLIIAIDDDNQIVAGLFGKYFAKQNFKKRKRSN